ncbi:HicB family protein [Lactobacillus sp. S2-2]|uniref:type II toxin-antitoxin system HicB family antitoxin n=1 Tax=Lactobacillus sp. S2-2 TaxID=2692917 RepID=UPI001F21C493|nr:type II toxin-antitoxin system HicB family antitoxin [Lactobacillus sp. S2-2]MCF6515539.1 HicB family protein [Lactobacillus sp. S2-2]
MENKLIYPVILHPEDIGYSVEIPDINNGIWTQGDSMEEALEMAVDAIGSMLIEETNYPTATPLKDIKLENENDIKSIVSIDMDNYRKKVSKTVRKNVSIPEYLIQIGKDNNVNFSEVLTQALEKKFL